MQRSPDLAGIKGTYFQGKRKGAGKGKTGERKGRERKGVSGGKRTRRQNERKEEERKGK